MVFRDVVSGKEVQVPLSRRVEDQLAALKRKMPANLKFFHDKVGTNFDRRLSRAEGMKALDEALDDLRGRGFDALGQLVSGSKTAEIARLFKQAFPEPWKARTQASLVELRFAKRDIDLFELPVELWPILGATEGESERRNIPDLAALEKKLANFVGFGAVVVRRFAEPFSANDELLRCSDNKVPIKIVRNESFYLQGATRSPNEVTWLSGATRVFDAEELWPDDRISGPEATIQLARCLHDPRYKFGPAEQREFGDQIQHFSCHYHLDATQMARFELRREVDDIDQLEIDLARLHAEFTDLDARGTSSDRPPGPFIFLNACASGAMDPADTLSLVEMLHIKTPARSILVTETSVHYPLTVIFARRVYEKLMSGSRLAEAVHYARWDMAVSELNPFGILYSLYGNPNLYLQSTAQAA